ncbi:MAG: hypothetical protein A3J39_01995 [Sulfuricurvum sp. RIFCSPHIGHO2_12_FULL_44_8]|nr:MAG: hypothetical protein A3J39_01995 [Sulfuricurvum sp. RIFCSPHIGHO2_12_FULL_44_8]
MTGSPYGDPEKGQTKFLVPEFLPREGEGIFFADEWNRAPREMQQALFQLALDGKAGGYTLPQGWARVFAGNLGDEDKTIVEEGDAAWWNRFMHIQLRADLDEWKEYMRNIGYRGSPVLNFLSTNQSFFLGDPVLEPYPTPRTWERVAWVTQQVQSRDQIYMLTTGLVGVTAAIAYKKFLKEGMEIEPEQVLENWKEYEDRVRALPETRRDSFYQLLDNILDVAMQKEMMKKKHIEVIKEIILNIAPRDTAIATVKKLVNNKSKESEKLLNKLTETQEIRTLLLAEMAEQKSEEKKKE